MDSCLVRVSRTNSYAGALSRLKVIVDGELAGRVRAGCSTEFHVTPGDHVFYVKASWARTPDLVVHTDPSRTTLLECGVAVDFLESMFVSIVRPDSLYYLRVVE